MCEQEQCLAVLASGMWRAFLFGWKPGSPALVEWVKGVTCAAVNAVKVSKGFKCDMDPVQSF